MSPGVNIEHSPDNEDTLQHCYNKYLDMFLLFIRDILCIIDILGSLSNYGNDMALTVRRNNNRDAIIVYWSVCIFTVTMVIIEHFP